MEILQHKNGEELVIEVKGRLDTVTAPELEAVISKELTGIKSLIIDFSGLDYISSAGLRVLLSAAKIMDKQGKMVVTNPNDVVKDVFDVTGFNDVLNIQD